MELLFVQLQEWGSEDRVVVRFDEISKSEVLPRIRLHSWKLRTLTTQFCCVKYQWTDTSQCTIRQKPRDQKDSVKLVGLNAVAMVHGNPPDEFRQSCVTWCSSLGFLIRDNLALVWPCCSSIYSLLLIQVWVRSHATEDWNHLPWTAAFWKSICKSTKQHEEITAKRKAAHGKLKCSGEVLEQCKIREIVAENCGVFFTISRLTLFKIDSKTMQTGIASLKVEWVICTEHV